MLRELGADQKRMLTVFNKVDALAPDAPELADLANRYPGAIFVSARSGQGIDTLEARMAELLADQVQEVALLIPYDRTDVVAELHAGSLISATEYTDDGVALQATIPKHLATRYAPWLREA